MAILLLVAEPSFSVNLLADSVRQLGYTVTSASPTDNLNKVTFDAILLILNADGVDEITRLQQTFPSKPIIVVNETGQDELTLSALRAGAASFINKSNVPRDIGDTLSEVLHTSISQLKQTMFRKRLTGLTCEYTLENDSDFIGPVVTQAELMLQQFRLFDESERMRIGVAIHEALVNAMIHGNLEVASSLKNDNWDEYHGQIARRNQTKPYSDRRVKVLLQATREQAFTVVIRDEGPGFDLSSLHDPTETDGNVKCSGRGMMLIRAFFDEVRHNEHGNEITMTKCVQVASL